MQKLVFTNGDGQTIDLTSVLNGGNFGITNWEGLSGVSLNIQTQQVPFQDGGVFLDALMEQREISVTVAIQDNNDLSARYERKRQLISALNPKLGEGVLVYTNDYLSRQIKAVPQLPIFENKNSNDAGTLKASVTFSCCSPYWEDTEDTVVDVSAGETKNIINNGDVKIGLKIEIINNADSIRILNASTSKQFQTVGISEGEYLLDTLLGEKKFQKRKNTLEVLNTKLNKGAINKENKTILSCGYDLFETDNYKNFQSIPYVTPIQNSISFVYCDKTEETYYIAYENTLTKTKDLENFTTVYTSSFMYNIRKLNGKFYVFASKPAYSTDGTTWTKINNPVEMYDGCFTGAFYISVCGRNIYKSTNGVDFSLLTTLSSPESASRIIYIEEKNIFIAIGKNIYTSQNATDWTTINVNASYLTDIVYSEQSGRVIISGREGKIYTSIDMITFEETQLDTQENVIKIEQGDNIYAYCQNGDVYISGLGEYWTKTISRSKSLDGGIKKLKLLNNEIIGTGFEYGSNYTQNGRIFKYHNSELLSFAIDSNINEINSLWFSEDSSLFVVSCSKNNSTGFIYASSDLETWTQNFNQTGAYIVEDYREKIIVYTQSNIYVSEDGENFSVLTENTNALNYIVYVKDWNLFIGIKIDTSGVSINSYIYKSTDCISWEQVYTYTKDSSSVIMKATENACFIFDNYVGEGTSTYIISSKDGNNWSKINAGQITMQDVILVNESYIMISYEGLLRMNSSLTKVYSEGFLLNEQLSAICQKEKDLYIGGVYTFGKLIKDSYENKIDKINTVSDMEFYLEKGENKISLLTEGAMTVSFRQKYIGV